MIGRVARGFAVLMFLLVKPSFGDTLGYIPDIPIRLGAGFNILNPDIIYPACIAASNECQSGTVGSILCIAPTADAVPSIESTQFAPSTSLSIKQINSKFEYFRELNISASVSGGYGPFSGSAGYTYHSIDDIDENSISWAVTAKSEMGSFTLAGPTLLPEFAELSTADIVSSCGPQYVAEVDRGVLASVLYTFHSRSERRLQEVSAKLSASFNAGFSANGNASFAETLKEFQAHGMVSVRVFTIGGAGVSGLSELITANSGDLDAVKRQLANYVTTLTSQNSAILGFRTASFGKLIGAPEVDPDYSSYLYFLSRIDEYRVTIEDFLAELQDVIYRNQDFALESEALVNLEARSICELELANVALQGCKLHFGSLTAVLYNGNDADDRAALNGMSFGVIGGTNGPGLISAQNVQGQSSCEDRLTEARTRLANALEQNPPIPETTGGFCHYGLNYNLVAELRAVPNAPFVLNYSFDAIAGGTPAFPAAQAEAAYFQLIDAQEIAFVEVKNASGQLLHHADNRTGAANFGFAVALSNDLRGADITVEAVSDSGFLYPTNINVPVKAPLAR